MQTNAPQMETGSKGEPTGAVQAVPSRGSVEAQLEALKERLLQPIMGGQAHAALARRIAWAANEASALAWYTVCPVLFLPDLLEEKVSDALEKWRKQERIRRCPARL